MTPMPDPEIRDIAIAKFSTEFRSKFDAGTREHNADGTRGLARMSTQQLIHSIREEIYDLYAYLQALELNLLAAEAAADMTQNKQEQ
tara:strand:+ start:60 stop:320 length:261 start_codon:yes stop_codon:yes gene_type:complete